MHYFCIVHQGVNYFYSQKQKILYTGTSTNNALQFIAAAMETSVEVATPHPLALSAQGRLQAGEVIRNFVDKK